MPTIERDEKCGWSNNCLHNDVPKTPHPKMAMSEDDDAMAISVANNDRDTGNATIGIIGKAFNNNTNDDDDDDENRIIISRRKMLWGRCCR